MVLAERIVDNAEIGEREKARTLIRGFAPLQRNRNQVTSVTKDDKKIIAALMSEQDFLFQFSGALGRVCGKFNRQDFVAFLGSYKSGKSWYLQYTAEEAARAGYKVLFISLEMSETDMIKRFWSSLAGYTPDSDSIEVPYFEEGENEKFFVSKKKIKRKRTLIDSRTLRDKQKLFRQYFRGGDIRIAPFAAGVAGLSDVLATIDDYERVQNYTPDIIVVDYADLLVDASRGEYRQNLDKVWRRLRGLAQERDCLVVTASQATRQAIGKKVSLATVAEDSRKIGHVTAMIGLNRQTQWEKNNLIGISQLAVRSGRREFRQAMVIYSYEMGRVVLDNKFEDEIDFEEEKEEQKVPIKRQRKKQAS
jgi:KaiC/GvpD/RAD55 family RecA-like ATPase